MTPGRRLISGAVLTGSQPCLVPTLVELLADPMRGRDLAPREAAELLVSLAALQASLVARVVDRAIEKPMAGAEAEPPPDRLLTVGQLAKMLEVKPRWIYCHADEIPGLKRLTRRTMRFRESPVLRWMASKKGGSPLG